LKSSDITDNQLVSWLRELEEQKVIFFYFNDDKNYLKFTTWENHQQIRARRRKNPDPSDENSNMISLDIMCNHLISDAPVIQSNPIQSNPNPIQSESNPTPRVTALDVAFEDFWNSYPKKIGKQSTLKAFHKVKAEIRPLLIPAVERQKKSEQWTRDNGQYIPNPTTWINRGSWDDELGGARVSVGTVKNGGDSSGLRGTDGKASATSGEWNGYKLNY